MASLFEKFKKGLAKTREGFVDEIAKLVKSQYSVDDDMLDKIEEILISADIGVDTSLKVIDSLKEHVNQEGFSAQDDLMQFLRDRLMLELSSEHEHNGSFYDRFFNPAAKPYVILLVGVNGTGKTTTAAKLAKAYRDRNLKVLLGAADTFRAAAIDQLEIWAKRADVDIVRAQPGADPAAVAFDAAWAAKSREVDVLIVDTAGRLHTKTNLMQELQKIHRVLGKAVTSAPHEILLVLDATTGQNAVMQAKEFQQSVSVSGLVVTKLDGTAKGGIVLSLQAQLGLPIRFIGLGEKIDDLKSFESRTFVEALFL
jgi:fused signal recognition particle receptor